MVVRYLARRFLADSGAVFADASLRKTLYGNWKLKNFENNFTTDTGYKIEKVGKGKMRLTVPDGSTADFSSEDQLNKFLGRDLQGREALGFIRTVTRDQTKWYQVYQRRNLRRFMKTAFGYNKWSYFSGKEGKDAENEIRDEMIDTTTKPYQDNIDNVLDCATEGTNCETDTEGRDQPFGTQNAGAPNSNTGNKGDSELKDGIKGKVSKAISAAKNLSPTNITSKLISKLLSKYIEEELTQEFIKKFVPIVGQILLFDQMSRVDHFFHSGNADESLRSLHKLQYANVFAQWLTIESNFKDPNKKMSGDEVNQAMSHLDGVEGSAAFSDVILNTSGGKKLDPNLGVNDTATPIKDDYNQYTEHTSLALFTEPFRLWYDLFGKNPAAGVILKVINFTSETLIKIALAPVKAIIPQLFDLLDQIGGAASKVLLKLVPMAADGTEKGADLLNAIDAGGAVTGQEFMKNIGGHVLSLADASDMEQNIAQDKADQNKTPLLAKLFSINQDSSITSKLVMAMPTSVGDATNSMGHASLAALTNPLSFFKSAFTLPLARADNQCNIYGLKCYGFTEAELDTPLDDDNAALDQAAQKAADRLGKSVDQISPNEVELSDCPDPNPNGPNLCRLDLTAIQSLNANFTTDDDGGIGGTPNTSGPGSPNTSPGTSIDLATLFDDSTNVACASNTKDLGIADGYHDGQKTPIRICAVSNLPKVGGNDFPNSDGDAVVNSRVSGAVYAMVQAAKNDGVNLAAGSAFRTMAQQQALCPCDGVTKARPGFSNHQMGLAIDFDTLPGSPGPINGNPVWDWLSKNADKFGYKNYPREAWHWSPTGN
jgi:hypothetical protein